VSKSLFAILDIVTMLQSCSCFLHFLHLSL